ncbi:MAG: hypothetical protein IPL46_00910 [Saprospiraceae bacterium]|nr:hypothetical protein [Saprospiraceae bacterium]
MFHWNFQTGMDVSNLRGKLRSFIGFLRFIVDRFIPPQEPQDAKVIGSRPNPGELNETIEQEIEKTSGMQRSSSSKILMMDKCKNKYRIKSALLHGGITGGTLGILWPGFYKPILGRKSKNLASIIRGFKIGVTKNARQINPDFAW